MTDEELRVALAKFALSPYWDFGTGSWSITAAYREELRWRGFIEHYIDADTLHQYRVTPEGCKFLAGD